MNSFRLLNLFLRVLIKLIAGIEPQKVEIEPGTTLNIWAPTRIKKTTSNKPSSSIVFLHGFFANGILTWFFQVIALSRKYDDVYVADLLFFGDSITDKPDRSVDFQAECLVKGLRKLGVNRYTVVGFSYGGYIAFKLAEIYPELVDSIILTGATMELNRSASMPLHLLLPEKIAGLKQLISVGSHGKFFTSFPNFIYQHFLEVRTLQKIHS